MPRIRKSALSGPASGLMEPRGELGFIQPRSSFSYQLPQLPQDVKLVWFASNKQSICLMYKYEQHTASLLWYNGPRRFSHASWRRLQQLSKRRVSDMGDNPRAERIVEGYECHGSHIIHGNRSHGFVRL